jgi:hypothetical protein
MYVTMFVKRPRHVVYKKPAGNRHAIYKHGAALETDHSAVRGIMDVIMLHPKKKDLAFLSFKETSSDNVMENKTGNTITVTQDGENRISVMGTSFVKPYMMIQSHGILSCDASSCNSIEPDSRFIPSKKAVQSIDLSRKILNNYISSFEGFVDKQLATPKSKLLEGVTGARVTEGKKKFTAVVGKETLEVDEFLFDPAIVVSATIDKPSSSIDVALKNATCAFRVDQMATPSKSILFCSDSPKIADAYKFKSYLEIYKEQIESARGLNGSTMFVKPGHVDSSRGSRFGSKAGRIKLGFAGASSCHVIGTMVCCKQGPDEQEVCY